MTGRNDVRERVLDMPWAFGKILVTPWALGAHVKQDEGMNTRHTIGAGLEGTNEEATTLETRENQKEC